MGPTILILDCKEYKYEDKLELVDKFLEHFDSVNSDKRGRVWTLEKYNKLYELIIEPTCQSCEFDYLLLKYSEETLLKATCITFLSGFKDDKSYNLVFKVEQLLERHTGNKIVLD